MAPGGTASVLSVRFRVPLELPTRSSKTRRAQSCRDAEVSCRGLEELIAL